MRFPPTTNPAASLLRASGLYARLAATSGSITVFDEQTQIRRIRSAPNHCINDLRDPGRNGMIAVNDARICVNLRTNPHCAP